MNSRYRDSDYIFLDAPVCDCGSWDSWKIEKTIQQADGKLQYATCRACERKKKIVWEIPPGGNRARERRYDEQ
jgi:hypothetical protein